MLVDSSAAQIASQYAAKCRQEAHTSKHGSNQYLSLQVDTRQGTLLSRSNSQRTAGATHVPITDIKRLARL